MKYFVIHSIEDFEISVEPLMNNWLKRIDNIQFLFSKDDQDMLVYVSKMIKEADKVIYIVGKNSRYNSNVNTNLKIALEEKKEIYIYKLSDKYPLNAIIENLSSKENTFETLRLKFFQKDTIISALKNDNYADLLQKVPAIEFNNKNILFEQYKIYVKTSEDLIERQQKINKSYISINSILISAIITLLTGAQGLNVLLHLNIYLLSSFIDIIGMVLCFSWISMIKINNKSSDSKIELIIYMEKMLALNLFEIENKLTKSKMNKKRFKSFFAEERGLVFIFYLIYIALYFVGLIFYLKSILMNSGW